MTAAAHKLDVLRKRAEFLAVAGHGERWFAPGFVLQVGARHEPSSSVRYGLTASRKVGGAVVRNRARRRLRALAAQILPFASTEHDYVLIAKTSSTTCPLDVMQRDLVKALKRFKLWHEKT